MGRIVVVSGYFNPVHVGHVDYLEEARKLGDCLVVIVNNDFQVSIKGSKPFMPLEERLVIVEALGCVAVAVPSIDDDHSVVKTIKKLWDKYSCDYFFDSMIFANGGDRKSDNIPEYDICEHLGIKLSFNIGGGKTQSSSTLLENVANEK
jgi:cytidyltransferase-like protein